MWWESGKDLISHIVILSDLGHTQHDSLLQKWGILLYDHYFKDAKNLTVYCLLFVFLEGINIPFACMFSPVSCFFQNPPVQPGHWQQPDAALLEHPENTIQGQWASEVTQHYCKTKHCHQLCTFHSNEPLTSDSSMLDNYSSPSWWTKALYGASALQPVIMESSYISFWQITSLQHCMSSVKHASAIQHWNTAIFMSRLKFYFKQAIFVIMR